VWDRQTSVPSTAPSSGSAAEPQTPAKNSGAGARGPHPQKDRSRHRPLLLRDEDRVAPRPCPDARNRAERGDLAFGTIDTWLAWKLSSSASTRRTFPTPPAHVAEPGHTGVGPGARGSAPRPRAAAASGVSERHVFGETKGSKGCQMASPSLESRAISRPPSSARPA